MQVSKQTYLKNVSKVIDFDVIWVYIYSIKTNERYIKYKPPHKGDKGYGK